MRRWMLVTVRGYAQTPSGVMMKDDKMEKMDKKGGTMMKGKMMDKKGDTMMKDKMMDKKDDTMMKDKMKDKKDDTMEKTDKK